jgi:hypothetical protein
VQISFVFFPVFLRSGPGSDAKCPGIPRFKSPYKQQIHAESETRTGAPPKITDLAAKIVSMDSSVFSCPSALLNFIYFLPFFIGLFLLGIIKGTRSAFSSIT